MTGSTEPAAEIAVIGGSGFYDFPDLEGRREVELETPFGAPS
ncbi:MAG TPA: 5'-methylthioadenosine phosphorylase, partial [Chloroflexota bacterium]|nr:5'-methylthioadenosine phosphorylase [Chloroflexota bacterium]